MGNVLTCVTLPSLRTPIKDAHIPTYINRFTSVRHDGPTATQPFHLAAPAPPSSSLNALAAALGDLPLSLNSVSARRNAALRSGTTAM